MMDNPVTDQVLSYLTSVAFHLESPLPWVKYLQEVERVELLADLAQAWVRVRQTGDIQALTEVLDDWEATAMVLSDAPLAARLQAPKAPEDYTSLEDVRADPPGDPAS